MSGPRRGPCEASLAFRDGPWGAIYGVKCNRPGRLRTAEMVPKDTILCDDCYVTILTKDQVTGDDLG